MKANDIKGEFKKPIIWIPKFTKRYIYKFDHEGYIIYLEKQIKEKDLELKTLTKEIKGLWSEIEKRGLTIKQKEKEVKNAEQRIKSALRPERVEMEKQIWGIIDHFKKWASFGTTKNEDTLTMIKNVEKKLLTRITK